MKKMKSEKKIFRRVLVLLIVVQILFVTFFVAAIRDNRQITKDDCIMVFGYVEDAYYFPKSRIFVTIDGKQYQLAGRNTNKNVPIKSIPSLIEDQNVEILVRKGRYFPYFNNQPNTIIVGLRCGSNIYCNLEDYNKEARADTMAAVILLPVMWIIITSILALVLFVLKI